MCEAKRVVVVRLVKQGHIESLSLYGLVKTQTKDVVQHLTFMLCNLTCLRREVAQHCNNIPRNLPRPYSLSLYGLRREVQQNYISAVSSAPSSIYTICL